MMKIKTWTLILAIFLSAVSLAETSPRISPAAVDSLVNGAMSNSMMLEQVLERLDTGNKDSSRQKKDSLSWALKKRTNEEAAIADSIMSELFQNNDFQHPEIIVDTLQKKDTIIRLELVQLKDTGLVIPFPLHMDLEKFRREMILEFVPEYFLMANPLYTDLIFRGVSVQKNWAPHKAFGEWYFGNKPMKLDSAFSRKFEVQSPERNILSLRKQTVDNIRNTAPQLFAFRQSELSDLKDILRDKVEMDPITRVDFGINREIERAKGIRLQKLRRNPWTKKANAMLQFSQNYVSPNWYQGGSDNVAILGIVTGQLNYDNKKNVQWDNRFEWRTGFNTVDGDTLRLFNTNDDILKINSKLGFKAGGNWYYSGSVDFQTNFFNNYKAINSMSLKATFLTPMRLNIGAGLDYKYKKLFSLMLSPLTFKYIYLYDTENINPKSFGISEGNKLKQFGSSFKAQTSFSPLENVQVDSRLNFYTNYEKVEIDWEVVGTFVVNRFLSTRLSLNPRFDNTVILAEGESAKLQFKELLTFGLSYKF